MKTISIITICYNAEQFIEETILSVIKQTYSNLEYIIIDGMSCDGTISIVSKYLDNINVFVSEKDKGIYDAMNKGISMASGDYIIFMNAGDMFASDDVLAKFANAMNNPKGLYYGNTIQKYKDHVVLRKEKAGKFIFTKRNICHQAICYPSKYLKSVMYDLNYKVLSDWATNIKLYRQCDFIHVDIPLCCFSMDGVSSNTNRFKDKKFIDDLPYLTKQYLGFLPYLLVCIKYKIRSLLCLD